MAVPAHAGRLVSGMHGRVVPPGQVCNIRLDEGRLLGGLVGIAGVTEGIGVGRLLGAGVFGGVKSGQEQRGAPGGLLIGLETGGVPTGLATGGSPTGLGTGGVGML
jgi:hypothetical protein